MATKYLYDVNRGLPVLLDDGARRYIWGLRLAYAGWAAVRPEAGSRQDFGES